MNPRPFALSVLLVASLTLSGCVATSVIGPDGTSMKRVSFMGDQSAAVVDLKNGRMEGYKSEQAQIAGAVAAEFLKAKP